MGSGGAGVDSRQPGLHACAAEALGNPQGWWAEKNVTVVGSVSAPALYNCVLHARGSQVINNNVRCYDESLEFAEALEERFAEHVKGGWCKGVGGWGQAMAAGRPWLRDSCIQGLRRWVSSRQRSNMARLPSASVQGSWGVWEVNCGCLATSTHPLLLPPAGSLDVEEACRGFLDLAKEAAAACVAVVFSDPAFAELFQRLYSRCDDGRVVGGRVGMGRERRWGQGAGCRVCAVCTCFIWPSLPPRHALFQRRLAHRRPDRQRAGHPGGLSAGGWAFGQLGHE